VQHSVDRILTTHVGSLPRPRDILETVRAREAGQPIDEAALTQRTREAVGQIVDQQVAAGIDVPDDGEWGKAGFTNYVDRRLAGFEPRPSAPQHSSSNYRREYEAFPEYYDAEAQRPTSVRTVPRMCTGPISYIGQELVQRDIENLKAALVGHSVAEAFLPAIAPSDIANGRPNEFYRTEEEYLVAIADAMHEEYKAIVDAGLLVQVDDPLMVTYYARHPELSVEDCRKWAESRVEVINHALRGLPEDRIRFHTCYSINMGPRVTDMEARDIGDIILKVNAGAYSFEAGNPRHDHEWRVWKTFHVPEGKMLLPGVITNSTVLVEHPQLVADRIARYAEIVGRENVIASGDCGFASVPGGSEIPLDIVMAKFQAMAEGARLATQQLWGGSAG
jgi:5-methyltetrahydropteroyltriglutamate--homocysteine methyltransferase